MIEEILVNFPDVDLISALKEIKIFNLTGLLNKGVVYNLYIEIKQSIDPQISLKTIIDNILTEVEYRNKEELSLLKEA